MSDWRVSLLGLCGGGAESDHPRAFPLPSTPFNFPHCSSRVIEPPGRMISASVERQFTVKVGSESESSSGCWPSLQVLFPSFPSLEGAARSIPPRTCCRKIEPSGCPHPHSHPRKAQTKLPYGRATGPGHQHQTSDSFPCILGSQKNKIIIIIIKSMELRSIPRILVEREREQCGLL